ncbi:glycerate kinase [uncultured Hydrogenophaga sp.]|uniref:glycerate kinase family protein n=1 Tax=uncultured Hydrogenophaga sp. TaxID=199683 RepID=UPI00265DEE37|nr:glycerate kinase [uncultured Hydrogenophaga sp.]
MNLTVLIAPSGFKESLLPWQAAQAMARGVQQAWPQARVLQLPLVDGGEGFAEGLARASGGHVETVEVCGPVGQRLTAHLGWLGPACGPGRTAVVEVAAAAGLRWVPQDRRNPLHTTSRGVGELISAALDRGAERILLGCGDSGINDGGAGMAQALGVRLIDADGQDIAPGAAGLLRLDRIDLGGIDPRLQHVPIHAAVNQGNRLLGPRGVARVHGPQKGATAAQVEWLEQALERWAELLLDSTGIPVDQVPGAGASGGLGAGLHALLGGVLCPRFDVVFQHLDLDGLLDRCDLVITGEGQLDDQTPNGKVPAEVARRARQRGLPVLAVAGAIGPGVASTLACGIDAWLSAVRRPCEAQEALDHADRWLAEATEQALRLVGIGLGLGQRAAGTKKGQSLKTAPDVVVPERGIEPPTFSLRKCAAECK